MHQCCLVKFHDGIQVNFEEGKEFRIKNDSVLHDFSQATDHFSRRQSLKSLAIDPHKFRLVECTDHIFPQRVIHGNFSANGTVDLSKQCRGYLDQRNPALIRRSNKTGQIANHTAAEGNDRRLAPNPSLKECGEDDIRTRQAFLNFAWRKNDR